ncbi:MAG: hypothetical protein ACK5MQ_04820 [Pikeienuella sp.]
MLTEIAPPEITASMQEELARHLRLSSGFAGGRAEEAEAAFRAAVAHLERALGLALIPRDFRWRGRLGANRTAQPPIGPVSALRSVSRVLRDGALEAVDPVFFRLDRVETRTRIRASANITDVLEFTFAAGFGADWSATPDDLRRAAWMLAAEHFDRRHASSTRRDYASAHGVEALIRPWRALRLGGRARV